jgi:hypothetical protein
MLRRPKRSKNEVVAPEEEKEILKTERITDNNFKNCL